MSITKSSSAAFEIIKFDKGNPKTVKDFLAKEEPLEILLRYGKAEFRQTKTIAITMRTPCNDVELALGFLFSEKIIHAFNDVKRIIEFDENAILVELIEEKEVDINQLNRNGFVSSSCGVCGKTSLEIFDELNVLAAASPPLHPLISHESIVALPKILRQSQVTFEATGGLHAAGLFDKKTNLIALREDVGRHNALDKLIGFSFQHGLKMSDKILVLSGRISFELVLKASIAAIPMIVAVGAPSSLAVQLSKRQQITLVGFTKNDSFNIYTYPERIA